MCCTGYTGGKGVCGALVVLEVRGYVLQWLDWR